MFSARLRTAAAITLCLAAIASVAGGFARPSSEGVFDPVDTMTQGPPRPVSFVNEVAPILRKNCLGCHNAKRRKGKLDMSTYDGLRRGGDYEDPIVPGRPEESYLIDLLQAPTRRRMPPPETELPPLSKTQIELLERWIKEGAKCDVPRNANLSCLP